MPPTDLPTPSGDPSQPPVTRPTRPDHDQESLGETQAKVAGMMIGTAMMFLGFLMVFLSISGGFELSGVTPMLLYFGGMAIWAYSTVVDITVRYSVMGVAIVLCLAFLHFGEILFWHKQVVFWTTVVVVMWFMFREPKPKT